MVKKSEMKIMMAKMGFNGTDLAKATEISQSYVVQVLNSKRHISPRIAKQITLILNCKFDDIFYYKEPEIK